MKLKEYKQSLKQKAKALREIKIGLKEAQRVAYFNSYSNQGVPMGWYIQHSNDVSPEQKERARKAYDDLYRCLRSYTAAKRDYRARHIAYCLFRGKTPEQIENNYYDGKWAYDINTGYDLEKEVNKHLEQLRIDNPPREEYKEAV